MARILADQMRTAESPRHRDQSMPKQAWPSLLPHEICLSALLRIPQVSWALIDARGESAEVNQYESNTSTNTRCIE